MNVITPSLTERSAPIAEGFPLRVQVQRAERIMEHVARAFGITVGGMLSHRRTLLLTRPRHVAWHITRELTPLSLPQIARIYNKDHTTVLAGLKSIGAWMFAEPALRDRAEQLLEECRPLVEIDPAIHQILTRAEEALLSLIHDAVAADPMRMHDELRRIAAAVIADAKRPPLQPGDMTREAIGQ